MVSSGLIDRVDVSHYRLTLHLLIAFFILSLILWDYLKLKNIDLSHQKLKFYLPLTFLILVFWQITIGALVSGLDELGLLDFLPRNLPLDLFLSDFSFEPPSFGA